MYPMTENYNFLNDENGFPYLDKLPEGFVAAELDDFHVKWNKKIGMFYLVKGVLDPRYYPRVVNKMLTGEKLLPFIEAGSVFVKKN
jgi:hypothetical protein